MRHICIGLAALSLSAGAALSAGIERTQQSVGLLFEPGGAVQFTYGSVSPDLSGNIGSLGSGDMAPSYRTLTFGLKTALSDKLDAALIFDQSLGADVDYSGADAFYPLRGTVAELVGTDITALLRYRVADRVSLFGGLRSQSIKATLTGLPIDLDPGPGVTLARYGLDAPATRETGYVVGAAYEIPDIAMRLALSYHSAIDHDFKASQTVNGGPAGTTAFTTTVPESIHLEFQTGIAKDTLLFGSVRWQNWAEFDIIPVLGTTPIPLIDYQSAYTTYTLGVGRRFNETWSGAVTLAHEPASGDIQGNLAPRDGYTSVGLAAIYRQDRTEITAGVRYIALGDAVTQRVLASFEDNDALAFGLRLTQRF